jgi:two-component system response regulator (stage 0 sporulation protein F)
MKRHVLIVDDQAGIRLLLKEVFVTEGFAVSEAANGQQAVAVLRDARPDFVLLDMKMPGMNGLEFLRMIHNEGFGTKVLMMTAYAELEMLKEAKQLGALGFFSKPFDINELVQEVKQLI